MALAGCYVKKTKTNNPVDEGAAGFIRLDYGLTWLSVSCLIDSMINTSEVQ